MVKCFLHLGLGAVNVPYQRPIYPFDDLWPPSRSTSAFGAVILHFPSAFLQITALLLDTAKEPLKQHTQSALRSAHVDILAHYEPAGLALSA
jgi:hypothetical protein